MKISLKKVALYGALGGVWAWGGFLASEQPLKYFMAIFIVALIDLIKD